MCLKCLFKVIFLKKNPSKMHSMSPFMLHFKGKHEDHHGMSWIQTAVCVQHL